MEEQVIKPILETHHPITPIMLSYLNGKVGMKKLYEWKEFLEKRKDNNSLVSGLLDSVEKILTGGSVEEMDFAALLWMILRFNRDKEIEVEIVELKKEIRRLKANK